MSLPSFPAKVRCLVSRRTGLLALMGTTLLFASAAPAAQAQSTADLSVVTTGSEETTADSQIAFSITVANYGPDPADDATLTDAVPTGATFVSFTQDSGPAFSCSTPAPGGGGVVSCSTPSLAAGAEAAFTLTVHVDSEAPPESFISDTASVSTSTFDPNEENNASTASTLVGPVTVADLGVQQSAPEGAVPGSDLTYAITATNGGPAAAAGATLSETLPDATTFVSLAAPAGWSCTTPVVGSGGDVTCTRASLPAGTTETFTLVVHIPSDTPSQTVLHNIVTVSTTDSDPNVENDQATTSTVVASADLSATLTAPATATAGDELAYTITVTNLGPDDANSAQLIDTLPAGMTFVSLIQDSGPSFSPSTPGVGQGGTVALSRSVLASGESAQFTLRVAIDPRTADGAEITNTASLSSPTGDPNPANNESSDATTVEGLAADLEVQSTGPATAAPGGTLTYTITVTNDGPDSAYDVVLAVPVPAHTTFVSLAQSDGPPFEPATPAAGSTGTVSATRDQLASGESAVFTLKVVVDAATADQTAIVSTATVTSAIEDPDASDDSSSVTTTVTAPATLAPVIPTPAGTAPAPTVAPPRKIVCRRVPRLTGKTYRDAKRTMKRSSCKVSLRRRGPLRRKSGKSTRVRSQLPKAGTRTLYRGQTIRVTLR
jgi:uncharacterized repeat protein (TIGR01451 family)